MNTLRHVIGWLGEKAAELKLHWDDPSAGRCTTGHPVKIAPK